MDEANPRRSTSGLPMPGWYPDPERAGSTRWWDGNTWASSAAPQAGAFETRPPYRSLRTPTRITLSAFVAYGIVGVVAVASGADRISVLAGLEDGTVGLSRAEFSDGWFAAIGILQLLVLAAAAAAFLAFFHRAYKNLRSLGYSTNHTTGWAIGGWFVPILSLVRPKQIANEIWQKSGPSPEEKPPRLLSWWWAAFIIQIVAAQIAFRSAAPADAGLDALNTEASIYLLSDFLDLAALVLVIVVTIRLSRRQENYAASVGHDIPLRQGSSSTAAPADRSATVVPLLALAVGVLVAAPLALASQRSDDREGPVARATGDHPGVEAVDETSAGAIDSACASFNQNIDGLAEPDSLDSLSTYFESALAQISQRDLALAAAKPARPDHAAAFERQFLGPIRADSERARSAINPVIEAARRGDEPAVDAALEAIPDDQGVVPDAVAYAERTGALSCASTFAPAEEAPAD